MQHLRANGFQVEAENVDGSRLLKIATEAGVTSEIASCHTAKVGGYVIEGHVPAEDIKRLLKERPNIAGIAVPGMPFGSPGMDQDGRPDPFDVIAFSRDGKRTVFARHR